MKMLLFKCLLLHTLCSSCVILDKQTVIDYPIVPLGKAIIENKLDYNAPSDNYFPHDASLHSEVLSSAVKLKYVNDTILIENKFNDGFVGHQIEFKLSKELDIVSVSYYEWDDVIDGSSSEFDVEKIIMVLDKNPFDQESITCFYTLQIKQEYRAGDILSKEGVQNSTCYKIFHGKFKVE